MTMNGVSQKVQWTVWGGLILVILTIAAAYVASTLTREPAPPVYWSLPDFQLTNQLGEKVTLESLRGKIWVADIIFTRCPGPCAAMTKRMSEVQEALPARAPVQLLSLTTDPEFDTPEVLREYGKRFGADPNRWWFLTGTKEQIYHLAVEGLKLTAMEKDPVSQTNVNDLFIHSTMFVVVDGEGRMRGAVEGLEPGGRERIVEVVERLRQERK